jgi:hypothetical protein
MVLRDFISVHASSIISIIAPLPRWVCVEMLRALLRNFLKRYERKIAQRYQTADHFLLCELCNVRVVASAACVV